MAAAIATFMALPSVSQAAPLALTDPASPGETRPAAGQSLFDDLFRDGDGYALPYPFERLTAAIAKQNGGVRPRAVLIPLGRSLQRLSADPDYFGSPRVVVGVDAAGARAARHLKDRLFIGYQPKSTSLEVISYNQAAGRFEFQVVSNYTDARKPLVEYADRELCTGCHQGHAPIFPIAQWNETNANPGIAARMTGLGAAFHGVPVNRGIDEPDALDQAVLRANRLILAPFVWRQLCAAAPGLKPPDCRAALLLAALRWRLGGSRGPWRTAEDAVLAAALHAGLRKLAPDGVAIASPSLPDRNPLIELDAGVRPMEAVEPEGVYDPALPRAAHLLVGPADSAADLLALAVGAIGETIPPAVIVAIDAALARHAGAATSVAADCAVERVAGEIRFESTDPALALSGYVSSSGGGAISRLALRGRAPLGGLKVSAGPGRELRLAESALGLTARLATGERLSPLRLGDGRAEITVIDDVAALRRAVAAMDPSIIEAGPQGFAPMLMGGLARPAP
ncbi:hypothetical protein [Emcibacter sp. SYSU 3D8]|uniref:hypothetical protein n=1 Tax=Emcibacter sp. SYSU 3D8 TaxID=3133969 RepID=UPI0031FF46DF